MKPISVETKRRWTALVDAANSYRDFGKALKLPISCEDILEIERICGIQRLSIIDDDAPNYKALREESALARAERLRRIERVFGGEGE